MVKFEFKVTVHYMAYGQNAYSRDPLNICILLDSVLILWILAI